MINNNCQLIIAFGHRKRRGKDLSAELLKNYVEDRYGKDCCETICFADPIYEIAQKLYGWAGLKGRNYYIKNIDEKETILPDIGKSPRQILIDLGLHIRNGVYSDTYAKYLINNLPDTRVILIPDLRFSNEIEALLSTENINRKVLLIKIDRDIKTSIDEIDEDLSNWVDWDFILDNNGTIENLKSALINIFQNYEK